MVYKGLKRVIFEKKEIALVSYLDLYVLGDDAWIS